MNMPETPPIADARERREALDPSRSFCVQAPAGSGKTELLTQRILKLLATCARPEEILAITFTRKAAAEMRKRLVESLSKARDLPEEQAAALAPHARLTWSLARAALEQDRRQGWGILSDTARLRVTTIDSFNSYLTGQLPVISGLGARPEISEDTAPLYREAVEELLAGLEDGGPAAAPLALLLPHLDNNLAQVQTLLCGLLTSRDQWLGHILAIREPARARPLLEGMLAGLVRESLAEARGLFAGFGARLMPLLHYAAEHKSRAGDTTLRDLAFGAELPGSEPECLAQWQALASVLLTQKDEPRKSVTVRDGFPAASSAVGKEAKALCDWNKSLFLQVCEEIAGQREVLESLVHLRRLPPPRYSDAQWEVLEALTRLLPLLVARLKVVLRRHGKADYVEVSSAALAALGGEDQPTDLALRLDYRIRHILVDEFQDTSSLQNHLLEKLCYGWQDGDGRTLFIVGDGMQSCYGFRNANVGLFLRARDFGLGSVRLHPLQLKVNFRSRQAVVDWVNLVFSGAFPARDDIGRGAVRYSASEALPRADENAGVDTLVFSCDRNAALSTDAPARAEAREVTRLVRWLRQEEPDASIAILVRYRSHLRTILPELRQAGIAWNASDIDPLSAYPEIRDLLTLCRALLNLADTTAWLALLRAPWLGLALPDVQGIAESAAEDGSVWRTLKHHENLAGLSSEARQRLARAVPALDRAREARGRLPLRAWLEAAWIGLGGPATLQNANILPQVESFFRLMEQHEVQGDLADIHAFERQLAGVFAAAEPDSGVRLHIMTIHKAKGLEFDFVILPGLGRQANSDDNPLIRWKTHLGAAAESLLISAPGRKGEEQDAVYQYLRSEAALKSAMEDTRLLYIGITRAARRAWLLGQVRCDAERLDKPVARSLLAAIWPRLEELDGRIPMSVIPVNEAEGGFSKPGVPEPLRLRRLPAAWQPPVVPGFAVREEEAGMNEDSPLRNALERQTGEIVHHCLKLAVEKRLDLRNDAALAALEAGWILRLRPWTARPEDAVAHIRRHLTNCLRHERAAWLLDPSLRDSASELDLSDYRQGRRRRHVVDRSFIDAGSTRWIIDYKTAAPASGQALADFLTEQEALYRPQLATYAELFQAMEALPVRLALFFTALPHFHEVPWAPSAARNT